MKRIAAVLLLWIAVFGGLALYMKRLETKRPAPAPEPPRIESPAVYALEVTTTFNVEPDPFALRTDDSGKPAALLVRIAEREIMRVAEVQAGIPVRAEPVAGIIQGMNEFFVEANMPLDTTGKSVALRMRLIGDGLPVAEQTFWSEGESRIAGTFRVGLDKDKEGNKFHHDK